MTRPRVSDERLAAIETRPSGLYCQQHHADCKDLVADLRDARQRTWELERVLERVKLDLQCLHEVAQRLAPNEAWGQNVCAWAAHKLAETIGERDALAAQCESLIADAERAYAQGKQDGWDEVEREDRKHPWPDGRREGY